MRLPVDVLEQHMSQILEGLLLWSEDSKNKFRLKVQRPHMHALHLAFMLSCTTGPEEVVYVCLWQLSPYVIQCGAMLFLQRVHGHALVTKRLSKN